MHSHLANCVCDERGRERLAPTSPKMVPTPKMLHVTLHIGNLFKHFQQSVNKVSQICQSKSYIVHPKITKAVDGLFKYIEIRG